MNPPLGHLTDALVDRYARQGPGTAFETEDTSIESHLSNCGECLDRVLKAQRVYFGLLEADPVNRAPYQNCPEEQVLQELAAGICSREVAASALQHAAQCDHCGPLLNRYLEEFSEELRPEDQAILNQLASGRPEWQERFVREQGLGTREQPKKQSLFSIIWQGNWWPKMALAGAVAAAILAVTAGPGLWTGFELHRADRLVAAAYAERRTIEMRLTDLPYARYDALPVERGDQDNQQLAYDRPALSDANAFVGRKLKSGKLDESWLQVEGRVSLLQGTSRSLADAQSALEKAHSKAADNPRVEIDLAAAYFENDTKTKPPNLQRTINLLNEVLHRPELSNEERLVALFDLAIAYEKTQAWDMAVPIWEQYLQLDSSTAWAKEAETHLKEAKSKLRPPRAQGYDHPAFFLTHVATNSLPVEAEEYQNIALELWLPRAVEDTNSDSYKAVAALSNLLEKHSDPWLRDMLAVVKPGDLDAVQALSAAILANEADLHIEALNEARTAVRLFAVHHNRPGEMRARIEEVYTLQRSSKASDCLANAVSLEAKLSGTRYRWLQAQLFLEKATCRNSQSELQPVTADLEQSLRIAETYRFPVLVLRNIALSAGIKRQQRKYDEAWKEAETGLTLYWQGISPAVRLDQFYGVMWQCARDTDSLFAAKAFLQQQLGMRSDPVSGIPKNRTLEVHLHKRLANIFLALKENALAQEENQKALLLKDLSEKSGNFSLVATIDAANFQLGQGDAEFALSTLKPVGELLKNAQDNVLSLNYFQVLGAAYLQRQMLNDAAVAYRSAIQMAESALNSLKDSGSRLQWMKAADDSYRGMVRVLLNQKKDEQALEFWEIYKGSTLTHESHFREGKVSSVNDKPNAQGQPDKFIIALHDQARLIYAVFNDGLQIWTVSTGGVQSKWISIKQEDLVHQVREFVDNCATSGSDLGQIQAQARKLFSWLLEPVILQLPESLPVIVELDRSTNALPMEALLSPDGWYFGGRYAIVYSPGILMERSIRRPEAIDRQESLLLVIASQAGGTFLPGEDLERQTIAQVFPNARIMDGDRTNWTQLSGGLSQSHVFHFIGHGKPDGRGAYLILNKTESLRAKDFSPELLQDSRLAVLSACSTGVSGENGLLDTDNLVYSFLSGGVPSVIASRWNVDSENTAKLISSFYRHLEKKESVAQSISEARREILVTQKHPYYWASFNLSGRAN